MKLETANDNGVPSVAAVDIESDTIRCADRWTLAFFSTKLRGDGDHASASPFG